MIEVKPEHSPYGFSGGYNYITCNGFIRMNKGLFDDSYNEPAERGTAVHELCEAALLLGLNCHDFVGLRSFNGFMVTEEMADAGQVYVSYIRQILAQRPNAKLYVELPVVLSSIDEMLYGTADCIIVDGDTIFVIDYKNGFGLVEVDQPIHVTATNQTLNGNAQTIGYTLAAMDTLQLWGTITNFVNVIVQPNSEHIDGSIRSKTYTGDEVVVWHNAYAVTFDACKAPDAKLVAGSQCKYCRAAGHCTERLNKTLSMVGYSENIQELSPELVMAILDEIPTIKRTLETVEKRALSLARQGQKLTNRKLVKSIVRAKCADEDAFIADALCEMVHVRFEDEFDVTNDQISNYENEIKDKLFNKKLIGMTQAKKVLPAVLVNKHFIKPEAGYTLVPLSDKRAAIAPDGENKAVSAGFKPIK